MMTVRGDVPKQRYRKVLVPHELQRALRQLAHLLGVVRARLSLHVSEVTWSELISRGGMVRSDVLDRVRENLGRLEAERASVQP